MLGKGGTGWAPHPEQPPQRLLTPCRGRLRFALSVLPKVTAGTIWKELFPLLSRGLVPAEALAPRDQHWQHQHSSALLAVRKGISHSPRCAP